MSDQPETAERWARPSPRKHGPQRNAGGLYRTAKGPDPTLGGVPLNTANAAVVAAVRLAYKVAEAQIDRSTRLARRLREAGDKEVGVGSDEKALDGAQKLVTDALLSGLEWWEGSVAEGRCPVKRLAAAEYQMLGTILGLGQAKPAAKPQAQASAPAAPPQPAQAMAGKDQPAAPMRRVVVVHGGDARNRRPVSVEACNIQRAGALETTVFFHCAEHPESEMEARVEVPAGDAEVRLLITLPPQAASGRWTCAVCENDGTQAGRIDISL